MYGYFQTQSQVDSYYISELQKKKKVIILGTTLIIWIWKHWHNSYLSEDNITHLC